jgi:hypothetical protein
MNSRVIKIVAIIAMTLDHVAHWGLVYDPLLNDVFRIIGRIAMPLFCMLVAYGVTKSRNPWKFAIRLIIFAIAVQVFLNLYLYRDLFAAGWYNVFFTLAFGVTAASLLKLCEAVIKKYKGVMKWQQVLCVFATFIGVIAALVIPYILNSEFGINFDYGMPGVLLVIMFYLALRHSMRTLKITCVLIIALWCMMLPSIDWWVTHSLGLPIQWFALMAVPFILLFVDRKLKITVFEKYAFYIFYPLHIAVIFWFQSMGF